MGGGEWLNQQQQQVQMPIEEKACESIVCALREFDFSTIAIILTGVVIVTVAKVVVERYLKHRKD